jgi:hypothetical protein
MRGGCCDGKLFTNPRIPRERRPRGSMAAPSTRGCSSTGRRSRIGCTSKATSLYGSHSSHPSIGIGPLQSPCIVDSKVTTYNAFAAPLHDRENFVLTADAAPLRTGFRAIGNLAQLVTENPGEDVWVIGGAKVYAETIGEAEELFLTQVFGDFDCTKFSPRVRIRLSSRRPE